jgi:hypothetical protein
MGYLGNSNQVQNFTPAVDYFNGNGSATAFTLSRTVGSSFDIQAFIENVPQNPSSAFTVAGNVITFTSAPPSGTNNIYVRYTSPVVQQVKPAPGTVGPTELNSAYSLWNLSGANVYYGSGRVGVGTSSPGNTLEVYNAADTQIRVINGTTAQSYDFGRNGSTGLMNFYGNQTGFTGYVFGGVDGERMRIASTGRVGVGISSPDYLLDVRPSGSLTGAGIEIFRGSTSGTGGVLNFRPSLGTDVNTIHNLSITAYDHSGDNNTDGLSINGYDGVSFCTGSNGRSERMRITQDGSILLGTSTQGGATGISFSNAADSALYGKSMYMNSPYDGTRNAISFAYNSAGGVGQIVTGTNSVSYQSGSDYRLKKDIAPMTGALATVAQLKPVTFKWKSDSSNGQGFIAHEIQAIVPDCATGEKDAVDAEGKPVYQGVDTSFLVATLTAAIQEQQAIIEDLKTRIEILENK